MAEGDIVGLAHSGDPSAEHTASWIQVRLSQHEMLHLVLKQGRDDDGNRAAYAVPKKIDGSQSQLARQLGYHLSMVIDRVSGL